MIVLPLLAVSLAVSVFTASVPAPVTPAMIAAKAGAILAISAGASVTEQAVAALPVATDDAVQANTEAAPAL